MRLRRGSRRLIRDLNVATVLNLIRRHEPISRVDLAERSRLGRSTITGIINALIRERLVVEVGNAESSGGRKPVLLQLNARARCVVAVKLAPARVTVALADLHARVLARQERPLPVKAAPELVVETLVAGVRDLLMTTACDAETVIGTGVVLPGIVDSATGVSRSSFLLGWENISLREVLEEALHLPVFIDNDANAFALAEHWYGAGQGYEHMLAVTVGIGVGAGMVIGGALYRGARWGAGEIGHFTLDASGPLCACGNRGCLEALTSDAAVARLARESLGDARTLMLDLVGGNPAAITRDAVVRAAQQGDRRARQVLERVGQYLGAGLANAVNLLHPEVIVVGGEAVLQAGDLLMEPLRHSVRSNAFSVLADDVPVVPAALGRDAWLMGAAAIVLDEVFKPPLYASVDSRVRVNLARTLD